MLFTWPVKILIVFLKKMQHIWVVSSRGGVFLLKSLIPNCSFLKILLPPPPVRACGYVTFRSMPEVTAVTLSFSCEELISD